MHSTRNKPILKVILNVWITLLFACSSYSPDSLSPNLSDIPQGMITGVVYDEETGVPVAGALVKTSPETVSATSSSDGSFRLNGMPAGTYDLITSKKNYTDSILEDVALTGNPQTPLVIWLSRKTGTITGTVTNTRGASLSQVSVVVKREAGNPVATTVTDASGNFTIRDLALSTYKILFTPVSADYWGNEKKYLEMTGNHTLKIILSGRPPQTATYVGSDSCQSCHAAQSESYLATPHAGVLKEPSVMAVSALTQFQTGTALTLMLPGTEIPVSIALTVDAFGTPQMTLNGAGPYPIQKIYGGHLWKENYLIDSAGETFVLPVAWSLALENFVLDDGQTGHWFAVDGAVTFPGSGQSYEQRCAGCHTSGFVLVQEGPRVVPHSTADGTPGYLEDFVGCERCHGPGSTHVDTAENSQINESLFIVQPRHLSLKGNSEVCGQCHSGGHDKRFFSAEVDYPVDEVGQLYEPGDDLDRYFDDSGAKWGGTGYSRGVHQEYNDYLQSGHYKSKMYNPRCSDCHEAHGDNNGNPKLLKQPVEDNTLCLSCHTAINFPTLYSIRVHTQHPYDPQGTGASRCVSCHMTKTGTVDQFSDVGGHTFVPVKPLDTLNALNQLLVSGEPNIAEQDLIPNPCMQCHNQVLAGALASGGSTNAFGGSPVSQDYLELLTAAFDDKFNNAKANGVYASFSHKSILGWKDKDSPDHHGRYYLANPETCTNACHGKNLQGGELSDGSDVPSCFNCHYAGPHEKRLEVDGWLSEGDDVQWMWVRKHKNYYTENGCTLCHGEDYAGGISGVSCYTCHTSPGVDFTVFEEGCEMQACHGVPPPLGAHDVHYNGVFYEDVVDPQYGDTTNYSTASAYRFGCGTCHPMSAGEHRNGTVDIELYNEDADPNTMKGKMPPNASFNPETRRCTNVYCHSYTEYTGAGGGKLSVPFPLQVDEIFPLQDVETQIAGLNADSVQKVSSYFIWNQFVAPEGEEAIYYWSTPILWTLDALCASGSTDPLCQGGVDANGVAVFPYDTDRFGYNIDYPDYELQQVRRYQTTPNWDGFETLSCGGCHGFPPRAYLSPDEWSENDPDWSDGAPSIRQEAAIDKHSFVIPKLTEDGSTVEVGHMANMYPFSNAPLRCQTCHFDTVNKIPLDDWEMGMGWSRENGKVQIENLSIDDKTYHVNGQIDVVFDTTGPVTSYRFNNTNYGYMLKEHPAYGATSPQVISITEASYYYGVRGSDSPGASWNPVTKTCSNVSCHLEQRFVTWTKPYRPYSKAECYQCHQYESNPTQGENETMCWPHSERNGCDDVSSLLEDMEIQINPNLIPPGGL